MAFSTSIEISYKLVDGWHIFEAADMPGFFVANRDLRRAYNSVAPTIEKLVKLDSDIDCRVAPDVPLDQFIGTVRGEAVQNQARKRFTLFKEAA